MIEVIDKLLTDEQMTKVLIIEDISKLYKFYKNEKLSVKLFDILYDLPLNKLERALVNIRDVLERENSIENLQNELNNLKDY